MTEFAQQYSRENRETLKTIINFQAPEALQSVFTDQRTPYIIFEELFGTDQKNWEELYRVLKIRDAYTPNMQGQRVLTPESILLIGKAMGQNMRWQDLPQYLRYVDAKGVIEVSDHMTQKMQMSGSNMFLWGIQHALGPSSFEKYVTELANNGCSYEPSYKPVDYMDGLLAKTDRIAEQMDNNEILQASLIDNPHVQLLLQHIVKGDSLASVYDYYDVPQDNLRNDRHCLTVLLRGDDPKTNIINSISTRIVLGLFNNHTSIHGQRDMDSKLWKVGRSLLHGMPNQPNFNASRFCESIKETSNVFNPGTYDYILTSGAIRTYMDKLKYFFRVGAVTTTEDYIGDGPVSPMIYPQEGNYDLRTYDQDIVRFYDEYLDYYKGLPPGFRLLFFSPKKVKGQLYYDPGRIDDCCIAIKQLVMNTSLTGSELTDCNNFTNWIPLVRNRPKEVLRIQKYLQTL